MKPSAKPEKIKFGRKSRNFHKRASVSYEEQEAQRPSVIV